MNRGILIMHPTSHHPFDNVPEPTPIAVNDMTVVDRVSLGDARFVRDHLRSGILALLNSGYQLTKYQHQEESSSTASLLIPIDSLEGDQGYKSDSDNASQGSACKSHSEKWNQRYQDLVQFRSKHGNCLVPLEFPENPALAHWVKHQRGQHKAKHGGKHSTLTDFREQALDQLGFVWDSHACTWEERFHEIIQFKAIHGHTNLPSKYPLNPQLSTWVKCQRRQYKLFMQGKKSHMTEERIARLSGIGFIWYPRQTASKKNSSVGFLPL